MQTVKNLTSDRRVKFKNERDMRSFLIMENLVRQKVGLSLKQATPWSPMSVIDYVEGSTPCRSMSEEISKYQEFISANSGNQFSVM